MRLIFISDKNSQRSRITFTTDLSTIILGLVVLCVVSAGGSYWLTKKSMTTTLVSGDQLETVRGVSAEEIAVIRNKAQNSLDAYGAYLANLQARLIRLDAMGERLSGLAGIDGEFDFSENVGLGGPEESTVDGKQEAFTPPSFMQELDELSDKLTSREKQLEVLERLIVKRSVHQENYIAGYPVKNGYITSRFGVRIDPITGRSKGHKGIDFTAARGTDIVSVGAGVVTFSGVKTGYGNVVEISHLDGYKTIYAHNQQNLVKAGDLVKSGQAIAKLGSSGRSTGPHVHFEVVKNNSIINPMNYISRVSKSNKLPIQIAKVE